jgi:hypothetical protein
MFPKWNDWDLKYTSKGLNKRKFRQVIRCILVIGLLFFVHALQKKVALFEPGQVPGATGIMNILGQGFQYARRATK